MHLSGKLKTRRREERREGEGRGFSSPQAGRVSWTHNYEANKYVALIVQSGTNEKKPKKT